jgi:hypothetical protein
MENSVRSTQYEQIGFVFSNCLFNPQKIWGLNNIGFVWLCFFAAQNRKILHKHLSAKILHQFDAPANWVCFFKSLLTAD